MSDLEVVGLIAFLAFGALGLWGHDGRADQ